jgi:50S ribosomal protein L16 3-hydroxylase
MPSLKINILGNLSPARFLQDYWQKRPCLIRQALPGYQCPLGPEELTGLACAEGVEARLVLEQSGKQPWQVKYSPLTAKDFKSLPETRWTLLVQGVEQHHAQIQELLNHFRFIPGWRIDDIMISYAATHGGVGPHLDSYDVFLLQGLGRRRWQINVADYTEKDFIPDLELRVIDNFRAQQEWVLESGDMLYLPPGVAHNGIALDPCMTVSIGFLAPARSELITGFIDDTVAATIHDSRFTDRDRRAQKYAGEISKTDLNRITGMMRSAFADDAAIGEWFGKYITRSRNGLDTAGTSKLEAKEFLKMFQKKKVLQRRAGARAAFIRKKGRLLLCINGEIIALAPSYLKLIVMITEQTEINLADVKRHALFHEFSNVLCILYNKGIYQFWQDRY